MNNLHLQYATKLAQSAASEFSDASMKLLLSTYEDRAAALESVKAAANQASFAEKHIDELRTVTQFLPQGDDASYDKAVETEQLAQDLERLKTETLSHSRNFMKSLIQ